MSEPLTPAQILEQNLLIAYDEPSPDGNNHVELTAQEAVQRQKDYVEKVKPDCDGYRNSCDADYLADFLYLHWCYVVR